MKFIDLFSRTILRHVCLWVLPAAALLFAHTGFSTQVQSPGNLPCLTNVAQIRALAAEEAERHYPVRLVATVTFSNLGGLCFVQDKTGAIFVRHRLDGVPLRLGQLIELEGVTLGGDWAPIVRETEARILSMGELPQATPVSFDELDSGKSDCQWVEIQGVVRQAKAAGDHLHLEMAVGGGKMRAYVYNYPLKNLSQWVDSSVRLRGAVGSIFNHKKQFAAPLLFVSGTNNVTVLKPSPADPFAMPTFPASRLLQYAPGTDYGHRVKVSAVVTLQEPGHMLFVRDGVQGLRLETKDTTPVRPGQQIEAVGFPVMGQYTPGLEDTIFRVIGTNPPPIPVQATVDETLSGNQDANLLSGSQDANLVSLQARMLNLVRRGNERILVLQSSNVIFNAHLPSSKDNSPLAGVEPGSRLQVTGICSIREVKESVSFLTPRSFDLLLRSPADIVVLQKPPWLTLSRLLWILGIMTVIILVGVAWVAVLNRRVQDQTEIIQHRVQREAVLEERSRIAREFHDTLEQELAGIVLQLDTVGVHLKESPALARQQLELARNLSRHTLAEARRSVWDLRSLLLENSNLATALTEVARPLTADGRVQIHVQTSGAQRKLPARLESNLLRITQEALANAIKHAGGKTILVQLDYEPQRIRLSIQDDGIGFDVNMAPGAGGGHFGLLDMRERAERSGASFSIESSRGAGTKIIVEVSEKNHEADSAHSVATD